LLVTVLLLPCVGMAEQVNGGLASAESATDYYQATCSDDGSGSPASLVAEIRDPAPLVEPLISVQIRKANAATSTTDGVDGDAGSSVPVWIDGGVGLYHVLVDKTGSGSEAYTLSLRCMTGNAGTGIPTGTTIVRIAPPAGGIDCSIPGGCTVTKYGLAAHDSYQREVDPRDPRQWSHAGFAGSYAYGKASLDPEEPGCSGERDFAPLFGQVLLREQTSCVPTVSAGCPVEVASDLANPGAALDPNRSFFGGARALHSPVIHGGSEVRLWLGVAANVALSGRGTRFAIPGGPGTRIAWDQVEVIGDESWLCCNDDSALDLCSALGDGAWARYPLLNDLSAASTVRTELPDWVFEGGPGTAFATDSGSLVAGQLHGVCAANRGWGCTASGTSCPGPEPCDCARDRCDPESGRCSVNTSVACTSHAQCRGFAVSDTCDLRELGWRLRAQSTLSAGDADPEQCGGGMHVFRGRPGQHCSLVRSYPVDGDPGPSCSIQNFGSSVRPDEDCDGLDDQLADLCPYYSELDPFADVSGDGRGDECECGDAAPLAARRDGSLAGRGDGRVDVSDLVAANTLIFSVPPQADWSLENPRCDADAPTPLPRGYREQCDVSDLIAIHLEIFSPGATARCARALPPAQP
jgi:hypothetical protein